MARFYGKADKFVRTQHQIADNLEIEPQRAQVLSFWRCDDDVTDQADGADRQSSGVKGAEYKLGAKIIRHKINMTLTPETVKPQKIYMGFIKLSFHDVYSKYVSGSTFEQASYHGAHTDDNTYGSFIRCFPLDESAGEVDHPSTGFDIGGINAVKIDDHFKHFVQLKQPVTIFDQQPLVSDKWMRVPAKVKRINPFTMYGMWIFNDSDRGATPSDTSIFLDLDSYQESVWL